MMNRAGIVVMGGVVMVCGGVANAQSINLEWGSPETAPSAEYAAVGLPGVWNTFQEMSPGVRLPLVGLNGDPVPADVLNIGFDIIESAANPLTSGEHEALLDDCYTSFNDPIDGCLFFNGLEPGEYEVIMYAVAPDDAALTNRLRVDENVLPPEFVGGEWTGQHVDGLSFLRQRATVGNDGRLGVHSGLIGANIRSVLNGMQIIKLSDVCTGDCNTDGEITFDDLICALFSFGTASFTADCDGNEEVDFNDLVCTLFAFGTCE